jgi:hypothetical protein
MAGKTADSMLIVAQELHSAVIDLTSERNARSTHQGKAPLVVREGAHRVSFAPLAAIAPESVGYELG